MHKQCNQCGQLMWSNNLKRHYARKHPEHWDKDKQLYLICPHCNVYFPEHLGNHVPLCLLNPNRENTLQKFKEISTGRTASVETKQKISLKRKQWLKENPDKHPWKRNSKFKSEPCEYLKKQLTDKQILFVEEYQPSTERYFSIDIAFPSLKFGIEVNGRQHYDTDFKLKEYYQERQNFLESMGWIILNVYYLKVYDKSLIDSILKILNQKDYHITTIIEDMKLYEQKLLNKEQKNICKCGNKKNRTSLECRKCRAVACRKYSEEDIQILIAQVSIKGFQKYAKEIGVSDNALRKRVLKYGYDPKTISPFAHTKNS